MYSYKSLQCYYCDSTILKLPEIEIRKFNGLNFTCECCGHQNLLAEFKFFEGTDNEDPYLNKYPLESNILD